MKTFLCLIGMLLVPAAMTAQAQEKFRVYLGTYTGGKTNPSKGIYQCELSMSDGKLSMPTLAGETKDPSFLAIHPNKKFLYAVNESQASVSAFAIDTASGNLKFLNSQPSQGGAPCHLIVDPSGKNVLAANYTGGSCICIPIEKDGKLGQGVVVSAARGQEEKRAFDPRRSGRQVRLLLRSRPGQGDHLRL